MKRNLTYVLSAISVLCLASAASAQSTVFGANNDGLGGFVPSNESGAWSEQAESVRYSETGAGLDNASLLREFTGASTLSTAAGSSYKFTGEIDSTSPGGNNNNRFAMMMFANTSTAADLDSSGIGVMLFRNGSFSIINGLSNFSSGNRVEGDWVSEGGAELGTSLFMLESVVTFTATSANVTFTLTDLQAPYSDSISTSFLLSELNLGDFHGVASRARSNQGGNTPFSMDVQSFDVAAVIPEPSAYALLTGALVMGLVMVRRRRS